MRIVENIQQDYHSIELETGVVRVNSVKHQLSIGGIGETREEAIKELEKNLRELEANVIPEIKYQIENL